MKKNLRNIFPNPTELLLIKAVCGTKSEFFLYWRKWRKKVKKYDSLSDASLSLFPLVHKFLVNSKTKDAFSKVIENSYRIFWVKNNLLCRQVAKDISVLLENKIEFKVLKGGAIIPLYYKGEFGVRNLEDIDLFVRNKDFFKAIRLLITKGWKVEEWQNLEVFDEDYYHAITLYKDIYKIDLHCHAFPRYLKDDDWGKLSGSQSYNFLNKQLATFSPSEHLVHTCVHGMQFNKTGKHRWIVDSVRIISSAKIDWDSVVTLAKETESSLALYYALSFLKKNFSVNIPYKAIKELKSIPVSFSTKRLFCIGLADINHNIILSIEHYWWIYFKSVQNKGLLIWWMKFKRLINYLSQTKNTASIPAIIIRKTSNLFYRSYTCKFS